MGVEPRGAKELRFTLFRGRVSRMARSYACKARVLLIHEGEVVGLAATSPYPRRITCRSIFRSETRPLVISVIRAL